MSTKEVFYNQFLIALSVFTCAMSVILALDSDFKGASLSVLICTLTTQLVLQRAKAQQIDMENKTLRKWVYTSFKKPAHPELKEQKKHA